MWLCVCFSCSVFLLTLFLILAESQLSERVIYPDIEISLVAHARLQIDVKNLFEYSIIIISYEIQISDIYLIQIPLEPKVSR